MSPAQPPRPNQGGKPGQGGKQNQPEHPAEKGPPPKNQGPPQRASKYVEIRKGKSGSHDSIKQQEDEDAPLTNVALPRSITQEQEQADLKARLGREELIDIDKRNALVKVKETAASPDGPRKRSNGMWLLVVVALIAVAAIIADKMHLLDKLKG